MEEEMPSAINGSALVHERTIRRGGEGEEGGRGGGGRVVGGHSLKDNTQ